jgi:hypothetical protein
MYVAFLTRTSSVPDAPRGTTGVTRSWRNYGQRRERRRGISASTLSAMRVIHGSSKFCASGRYVQGLVHCLSNPCNLGGGQSHRHLRSCPDLLCGRWERRLPEYAVRWLPSLLWLALLVLVAVSMTIAHVVMLILTILILIPSFSRSAIAIATSVSLVTTIPFVVGIVRLFWHMRRGGAERDSAAHSG